MPVLQKPKEYFVEDIGRARNLLAFAREGMNIPDVVKNDILRTAWMMAVGACDAYFCDAYCDLLVRTFRALDKQKDKKIPDAIANQTVPVKDYIISYKTEGGWKWRNYGRKKIEKENVLALKQIKDLMNPFLKVETKLFNESTFESWILHPDCKRREIGILPSKYKKIENLKDKKEIRIQALAHFEEHYKNIFQRRHDCIHNCDRPKSALQNISDVDVEKTIEDIEFLVCHCHEIFETGFPLFLTEQCGFSKTTKTIVCL